MKLIRSTAYALLALSFMMIAFQNCGPQLPGTKDTSKKADNGSSGSGGGSFTYAPTPTPEPGPVAATPTPAPGAGPSLNAPDNAQFVQALYMTAFDRFPTEAETQGWLGSGKTRKEMRKAFATSEEFLNRNMSIPDVVTRLFRLLLNRESDAPGRAYHEEALVSGVPRADVVKGFIDSPEFMAAPENQ